MFDILGLIVVVLLVLANAFFVAAEFSLVSVRRTRVAELVAQGDRRAALVQKAIDNPDKVIAATQLGITLASLGLGWVGEPALQDLIEPVVSLFPQSMQVGISHGFSATIAFCLITFLHVVVGELAPKSIALQDPENTSRFVAGPTLFTEWVFKPAIWVLNGTGNALLRLLGIRPASGHQLVHSVEELKMIVDASAQSGVMQAEESEMLHAVFDFGELIVRQVMVPRTEMVAVEADTPLEEIIRLTSASMYTKFPVFEDSLDQILGIVHVKDLLVAMQSAECRACVARDFVREAIFIPETASVRSLLQRFRDKHQHAAIVLDEFGGTAGMVTLEDLLEEIVGEVSDQFDRISPQIQPQADGSYVVEGLTLIEDVNENLGLNLQDPYYDTIAGYVMGRLKRIPRLGDAVDIGDMQLRVLEMDGLRIAKISVQKKDHSPPSGQAPTMTTPKAER